LSNRRIGFMKTSPWPVHVLLIATMVFGCQRSATDCPQAQCTNTNAASEAAKEQDDEADIRSNLAKLPAQDRKLAEEQAFCAVEEENRLGSMGTPVKILLKGSPVFLCCKGCVKKAQNHPEEILAKAEKLKTAGSTASVQP
jgi:hypothetical protein